MSKKKEANVRRKEPIDYLKIGKIIDPVLQTLFIILIFYLFDRRGNRYQSVLATLIRMLALSTVIHIFLKYSAKLKIERLLFILALVVWFTADRFYYQFKMKGGVAPNFTVILGKGPTVFNVYDSIYVIAGMTLAIWYFSISIREITQIVKSRRKLKRK